MRFLVEGPGERVLDQEVGMGKVAQLARGHVALEDPVVARCALHLRYPVQRWGRR